MLFLLPNKQCPSTEGTQNAEGKLLLVKKVLDYDPVITDVCVWRHALLVVHTRKDEEEETAAYFIQ